jgi:hypothetical protein
MSYFQIKNDDANDTVRDQATEVFTFKGTEDYLNAEEYPMVDINALDEGTDIFALPDAYAIRVDTGTRIRYYVKRGKYGKLFNPIGLYSEGTQRKQHRHAGKPAWEFKEATQKVFTYYIKFLRSRNAAWLNNAEREV